MPTEEQIYDYLASGPYAVRISTICRGFGVEDRQAIKKMLKSLRKQGKIILTVGHKWQAVYQDENR